MEGAPSTEPPGAAIGPEIDTSTMARAYTTALSAMARVPAVDTGYRLFWVRDGRASFRDLPAGGAYAVAGSHERCDVVIEGAGVALRHLIAATVALSDGVALRLLDLHTDLPFFLQDDVPRRSIVAAGPVVVRLARAVIGAIPVEAGRTPEAPQYDGSTLPVTEVEATHTVPVSTTRPSTSGPSRVSSLPPSRRLTDLPAQRRSPVEARLPEVRAVPHVASPATSPEGPGGGRVWTVSLERDDRRASVELSDADLALGVMIGRSDSSRARCLDAGLQAVLDTNVSRGHVLLLHHHEAYEAFDLCSTQGTWCGGERTTRRRLGDERSALRLATARPVTFCWHGRREAR